MKSILLALFLACGLSAQSMEVVPPRVLIDESAVIRAQGLPPGQRVTIRADLTDGAGEPWASQAEFLADAQGNVDTSRQAPAAGSYQEVSAMGLVWSMLPAAKKVNAYTPMRNLAPQFIEFHLLRQGQQLSSARLEQVTLADGVAHAPITDDGLRGSFFVPAGTGKHPGILVVGGSNGGLPVRPAAWLASHGYAALALAYFRFEDLPQQLESIPLEYFQRALQWLANRPEVAGRRLAVMGTSRGGELALQLGSMFPIIGAVVAYVPANVRYASCCRENGAPAWTWQGKPLPYVTPRIRQQGVLMVQAEIEVERTGGPILMISGEDDHIWHSRQMSDDVLSRLKRKHFTFSAENLKYPHAGHLAGRPEIVPAWHGEIKNPTSGKENDLGGSAPGDAKSSIDSIPKVLEFLRQNLAAIQ